MEIVSQISAAAADILQTLYAIVQAVAVIALCIVVAHVLFTVREHLSPREVVYRTEVPEIDTEDDEK